MLAYKSLHLNLLKNAIILTLSFSALACASSEKLADVYTLTADAETASMHTIVKQANVQHVGELKVATWNVEHLAFPSDSGCRARSEDEIAAMREYAERVDADIFALQEVASEQAVRQIFPEVNWQVLMSPRENSEPYVCRESGKTSTQQKVAYAVKKTVAINSVKALSTLGLNMPGLRYGLELNVDTELGPISILNVHMKSGCFVDNYTRSDREACAVFAQQAPILDAWIEEKERSKLQYMVLGDFNHRLSAPYNHLTQAIFNNSDGSNSTLHNATEKLIGCHPYYPAPIDLIFIGGMYQSIHNESIQLSTAAHNFNNMEPDEMLSDHCAVSLTISSNPKPITNAVKWQTQSKEYSFLTRAIYQQAQTSIEQIALPQTSWVVVMDVDETILDNSQYQVELDVKGDSYSSETWAQWVQREQATLVPGAAGFIQSVLDKGGKLALVTNRDKSLDEHTWRNLQSVGLKLNAENTCLLGRSAQDKNALGKTGIINDKDLRRQQVINGQADCFKVYGDKPNAWSEQQSIVMEVGDNIEDFSGVSQETATPDALVAKWPTRLILLPNPMYGSW
jgi:5'-nucleotidase (lipoprotein e(P4) family)